MTEPSPLPLSSAHRAALANIERLKAGETIKTSYRGLQDIKELFSGYVTYSTNPSKLRGKGTLDAYLVWKTKE